MTTPTDPRPPRRRKTDEERAATQTRARLKKRRQTLEAFLRRLEALHEEGANYCVLYAGVPILTDEYEPMRRSLSRTEEMAAGGCAVCVGWLEETEELRARIDLLRNTPLPKWNPSRWPPTVSQARHAGKPSRKQAIQFKPADVIALLAERETRRQSREAETSSRDWTRSVRADG